jgi:hypothetical protein
MARAPAISSAFEPFLERMVQAYDRLVEGAPSGTPGPWPVRVVRVPRRARAGDGDGSPDLRAAVRPLLGTAQAAA